MTNNFCKMMLYELVERDTLSMRVSIYAWVWTWNDIKYGAGNKFYCNYVYMGIIYEIRTFHIYMCIHMFILKDTDCIQHHNKYICMHIPMMKIKNRRMILHIVTK